MTTTQDKVRHMQAAIKHEQAARAHQNDAVMLAGRGDYIRAYESLGKALAEMAEANIHRKLVGAMSLGVRG